MAKVSFINAERAASAPKIVHRNSGSVESTKSKRLMNDAQAALKLGVSPATLRSWRCRGIGPSFVKMGVGKKAPVRYSASDVEQFIAECRQVPPVRAAMEN